MQEDYKRKLVIYFKKNLVKGYTADSLRFALMSQGYSRTAVVAALEQANKEIAAKAPVIEEKPRIKYEIIDEYDRPITIKKSFWKRWPPAKWPSWMIPRRLALALRRFARLLEKMRRSKREVW